MNLLKALFTVSSLTLLSRITGLIRETLIARTFGASAMTDAFNVAFRIPNLLRRLFAEGAFSQAFVPILGEYRGRQGEAVTKELVDSVATVMVWILFGVSLLGVLSSGIVVAVIATGFRKDPQAFDAAVFMTRVMFPYIGFISLVALASGILNTWRQFAVPAITPVLLNLSFIIGAIFVAPHMSTPIYGLAFSVMLGGIIQLAIQIPALANIGMLPRIHWNVLAALAAPGVSRIVKQMGPAVLAVSAAQLSLIINTNIASRLQSGSVSWLTFGDRLMEFPTGMLGVALGTILLPSLTKAHANQQPEEYARLLDWGLRLSFLLAIPAAVGLATFGIPMTTALFHYGKFTANDVEQTHLALTAYAVGLLGLILIKILAPGFYARQNIKTPVKIALCVLLTTQLLNLLFVPIFAHAGLALSISIAALLNAGLLFRGLYTRGIYRPSAGWHLFMWQLLGGNLMLAATLSICSSQFDWIALQSTPMVRLLLLFACGLGGLGVYFLSLMIMGLKLAFFRRKVN